MIVLDQKKQFIQQKFLDLSTSDISLLQEYNSSKEELEKILYQSITGLMKDENDDDCFNSLEFAMKPGVYYSIEKPGKNILSLFMEKKSSVLLGQYKLTLNLRKIIESIISFSISDGVWYILNKSIGKTSIIDALKSGINFVLMMLKKLIVKIDKDVLFAYYFIYYKYGMHFTLKSKIISDFKIEKKNLSLNTKKSMKECIQEMLKMKMIKISKDKKKIKPILKVVFKTNINE